MILRLAVAEVQPHHVNASANHLLQQCGIAGSGAQGGNNLGSATWHETVSSYVAAIFTRILRPGVSEQRQVALKIDLTGSVPRIAMKFCAMPAFGFA
jgi:hypothetical protein